MLKTDITRFHNFKCGEVFCLAPQSYNVQCCLCGQKINFKEFIQHFVKHLGFENVPETPDICVLNATQLDVHISQIKTDCQKLQTLEIVRANDEPDAAVEELDEIDQVVEEWLQEEINVS